MHTYLENTWFVCGSHEKHIGTLLPKRFPKQKTCQVPRNWVICDYLVLQSIQVTFQRAA